MVDIAERIRDEEATGQRKNAAQWIELFAHYFVTQRHIMVKTRGVTAKEGTVTQINPDSVYVLGIHGAGHQIPFRGIGVLTPVGDAETPLGPMATQHIYQFAGYMARREHLRLETADDVIEEAEVRQITLTGIAVADAFNGVEVSVPFKDIAHIVDRGME